MQGDLMTLIPDTGADCLVLYDEGTNANMQYTSGVFTPDSYMIITTGSRQSVILPDFEVERAKKKVHPNSDVYGFENFKRGELLEANRASLPSELANYKTAVDIIVKGLESFPNVENVGILTTFPAYMYTHLKEYGNKEGFKVTFIEDPITKARATKSPGEIDIIQGIQTKNETLMYELIGILNQSRIGTNDKLFYHDKELTKGVLRTVLMQKSFELEVEHPIGAVITCGEKAADPHEFGEDDDIMYANQTMVYDLFPRSTNLNDGRYWGDMTRTLVMGEVPTVAQEMYDTVIAAQDKTFSMLKPGVPTSEIGHAICQIIEDAGFNTLRKNPKSKEGFLHSVGHGVGLHIHDTPNKCQRIAFDSDDVLAEGHVFSVEPGIYIPRIKTGIRVENLIAITKTGYKDLNTMTKSLNPKDYKVC